MKFGSVLFLFSVVFSFIILSPTVKEKTSAIFWQSKRSVLSQLDYSVQDVNYKIIKLNSSSGLSLEIYRYEGDKIILLDSETLTDKKDAYYKFGESKHNLFLKDINSDGTVEIIVPSLDKNLKARLNVFLFDDEQEKLQKVTKH